VCARRGNSQEHRDHFRRGWHCSAPTSSYLRATPEMGSVCHASVSGQQSCPVESSSAGRTDTSFLRFGGQTRGPWCFHSMKNVSALPHYPNPLPILLLNDAIFPAHMSRSNSRLMMPRSAASALSDPPAEASQCGEMEAHEPQIRISSISTWTRRGQAPA